jgi:hypothetical protein
VVDQTSATLGVSNERVIPVNSNHATICKFTGVGDEVYKLVLSQIQRLVEEAAIISAPQVPLIYPIQMPDSKMDSDGWGFLLIHPQIRSYHLVRMTAKHGKPC